MSKHTPGPWHVEGPDDDPYGKIGVFAEAPSHLVCELWQDDAPDRDYNAEQWDNARLIAAAPEMYGYLCEVLSYNRDKQGALWQEIRATLKRIDGEQL